jgi:hypothetical protein
MPNQHKDHILFYWIAPEYIQHQKSARWYQIAGVLVALTVIYSFASDNWSMGLAVITFAFVYQYLHHCHPPKDIQIEITKLGIRVGQAFYPYSHIQTFWIIYEHGHKTLNLRMTQSFFYDICIHLTDQDPVPLRRHLVGEIPEWEGKSERLGDIILRLLKI